MTERRSTVARHNAAMETESDFQDCASQLKALADPDRLKLVTCLLEGEKSVSTLAKQGRMSIVKASHHLCVLRAARLVTSRKHGKYVIYSLPSEIATASAKNATHRTIDLGCCQLDLVQLSPDTRKSGK